MKKIKSIFFLIALFCITSSFAQDNMKYAQCVDCGMIAKVSNDASWRPTKQEYSCPKTGNTRACSFHKLCTAGAQKWVCSNCGEKVNSAGQKPESPRCTPSSSKYHNWEKK